MHNPAFNFLNSAKFLNETFCLGAVQKIYPSPRPILKSKKFSNAIAATQISNRSQKASTTSISLKPCSAPDIRIRTL